MKRHYLLLVLTFIAACTQKPYRLPYVNGTEVVILNDHNTHTTPVARMFDIRATAANTELAAAKAGWVRYIKDTGNSASTTNNYVWIEHPLNYCQPSGSMPPGSGGLTQSCQTCDLGLGRCNEWTLYAHMAQNSVVGGAGLSVGDWVTAGQPIGVEGDVGFTPCAPGVTTPLCGRHVHFTIWTFEKESSTAIPSVNGDYKNYVDFATEFLGLEERPELVPLFCTTTGLRRPRQGDVYVAAGCP